jgi:heat shock protein HslJ
MTKAFAVLLSLICTFVLTACSAGPAAASLPGTNWKLVSYGSASAPQDAAADIETHLTFGSDGTLGGNMGCNSFGGTYSVQDSGHITFGSIVSTLMACPDPQMAQEGAAFQVLKGTATYQLVGTSLTITSADGETVLVLTRLS